MIENVFAKAHWTITIKNKASFAISCVINTSSYTWEGYPFLKIVIWITDNGCFEFFNFFTIVFPIYYKFSIPIPFASKTTFIVWEPFFL